MARKAIRGDKNLHKQASDIDALIWHNPQRSAVAIEGLPFLEENNDYGRLPQSIRSQLRESLAWVSMQPSGVTMRFRAHSSKLAIKVSIDRNEHFPLNTLALESGFDVYLGHGRDSHFLCNLSADKAKKTFTADCRLPEGLQDICIYFPVLNPVRRIQIGLDSDAEILPPRAFKKSPLLFYGSSITQGFSCSRPGLTYPAQVCRRLQAPLINMGFGGNAKGDLIVADTFAKLIHDKQIGAFVYDYDHNTPSLKHLRDTHERFFKRIRKAQADLPILIVSSPIYWRDQDYFAKRFNVIERTYKRARDRGDEQVYLLAGKDFFAREAHWQDCTVDRLHPNDIGFERMATHVTRALKKLVR